MPVAPTQDHRVSEFKTPLGKDKLVLTELNAVEGLGEIFEYTIECVSMQEQVDFTPALGVNASVTVKTYGNAERVFNGVLVAAQFLGPDSDFFRYRITLRPWLWLLTKRSNSRIFAQQSVEDIIKKVFSDAGQSDFEFKLKGSFKPLEYCVQYRETDFNFVSRLMEQNGITYYFKHTSDKHTLVLADDKGSHDQAPLGTIPFVGLAGRNRRDRQVLFGWQAERRFHTGKMMLNDYNYLKATASMRSSASAGASFSHADYEQYDFPGGYEEREDGDTFVRIRQEAEAAMDKRRYATGDAVTLMPGHRIKVEKHFTDSENNEYLTVRCHHAFRSNAYRSAEGDQTGFFGEFEFVESARPFRNLMHTPKPLIHGVQTAKVVGKSGEEIDVDEHGRILVEFFWERDKKPSRRVRVAQIWGGRRWGGIVTPRIDMEVVVEFIEGDPDRPLVTGCVYNSENKVPYDLPGEKTKSGVKSNSSKGGSGYNEFVFDDKKGAEKIIMHAQQDHEVVILNSETVEVGASFKTGTSRKTVLKNGDDELTLEKGDQKIDIKLGKQSVTVMQGISIESFQEIKLTVGPSSITIAMDGITLNAPTISLVAPMIDMN